MLRSSKDPRFQVTRQPPPSRAAPSILTIVAEPKRPVAQNPLDVIHPKSHVERYMERCHIRLKNAYLASPFFSFSVVDRMTKYQS